MPSPLCYRRARVGQRHRERLGFGDYNHGLCRLRRAVVNVTLWPSKARQSDFVHQGDYSHSQRQVNPTRRSVPQPKQCVESKLHDTLYGVGGWRSVVGIRERHQSAWNDEKGIRNVTHKDGRRPRSPHTLLATPASRRNMGSRARLGGWAYLQTHVGHWNKCMISGQCAVSHKQSKGREGGEKKATEGYDIQEESCEVAGSKRQRQGGLVISNHHHRFGAAMVLATSSPPLRAATRSTLVIRRARWRVNYVATSANMQADNLSFALEDKTKPRRLVHHTRGPPSRSRSLESPEKRNSQRKSGLPSAHTTSLEDNDVFGPNYQRHHPYNSSSRPASRASSSSSHRSRLPDETVTVEPLNFSRDEFEDGKIIDNQPEKTPRVNRTLDREPSPLPPPQYNQEDVAMNDVEVFTGFPDAGAFKALQPKYTDESPHGKYPAFEPTGPEDAGAAGRFMLNTGNLPRLVIAFRTAVEGLDPEQIRTILEDSAISVLIQPFLAGDAFWRKHRVDFESKFKTAVEPITGADGLILALPASKKEPDIKGGGGGGDSRYRAPRVAVGICENAEVARKLVRHGVIAIDKEIAAHVYLVDEKKMSWTLVHLKCNMTGGNAKIAACLRYAGARAAFDGGPIRNAIVMATQAGATTSADERVWEFVRSLHAVFYPAEKDPMWVLYGKPCTTDVGAWEKIRELFRQVPTLRHGHAIFEHISNVSGNKLRPASFCYLCGLDDHRYPCCPYRSRTEIRDWVGPDELYTDKPTGRNDDGRGGQGYAPRGAYRGGHQGRGR
ncbi:hypothetical protein FB45DRAFT_1012033 [Roridomyces roridus]|uniref:Uncharacterized protein n=1 Tax=Roridomyces roridus TaxID=1738132 RepID=A0AAD7F714_9AGAR|nr:hypothetical protein FB45DRAFT_1012033 [Roridomyces roridus]